MTTFQYRAKSLSGQTVDGSLRADSLAGALDDLSKQGYFPLELRERQEEKARPLFRRSRVSPKDLSLFARELADLVQSGLPLPRVLDIAKNQTSHLRLRETTGEIIQLIRAGKSLHEAFTAFPEIFPPLYVSLVRAGEMSGALGETFQRLADYEERQEEFRAAIRAALAYPLLVAAVGAGTVAFLVSVVVPKLSAMFSDMGQSLPLPTRLLIHGCDVAVRYGWIVLPGMIVAAALAFMREEKTNIFDRMALKIPLAGFLVRRIVAARFARTLGILLGGGVPLVDSLRTVADVMGNKILRAQTLQAAALVQQGISLAESLQACADFPSLLRQMVAVGEEGNTVEKSLERVAVIYERESNRTMKTIISLVEPALILAVGGVVGVIVVAMLLPIFQIPVFVR